MRIDRTPPEIGGTEDRVELVQQRAHPVGSLLRHRDVQVGKAFEDTGEDQEPQGPMAEPVGLGEHERGRFRTRAIALARAAVHVHGHPEVLTARPQPVVRAVVVGHDVRPREWRQRDSPEQPTGACGLDRGHRRVEIADRHDRYARMAGRLVRAEVPPASGCRSWALRSAARSGPSTPCPLPASRPPDTARRAPSPEERSPRPRCRRRRGSADAALGPTTRRRTRGLAHRLPRTPIGSSPPRRPPGRARTGRHTRGTRRTPPATVMQRTDGTRPYAPDPHGSPPR